MHLLIRRPSVFVAVFVIVLEGIVTLCASLYPRSEHVLDVGTVFGHRCSSWDSCIPGRGT